MNIARIKREKVVDITLFSSRCPTFMAFSSCVI